MARDRVRGVLWSRKYLVAGRRPPPFLVKRLTRLYPTVRLEFEPTIGRWMLWEIAGRECKALKILEGENGLLCEPTIENTIGWLGEACVRGRINNVFDMERFLDGIDKVGQTKVDEVDRKAKERIHEGSERLWSAMNKGARIVVP